MRRTGTYLCSLAVVALALALTGCGGGSKAPSLTPKQTLSALLENLYKGDTQGTCNLMTAQAQAAFTLDGEQIAKLENLTKEKIPGVKLPVRASNCLQTASLFSALAKSQKSSAASTIAQVPNALVTQKGNTAQIILSGSPPYEMLLVNGRWLLNNVPSASTSP